MKWNEVFSHTFKELRKHIEPEVSRPSDFMLPSFPMIEACRANDFDFFLPFLDSGRVTIYPRTDPSLSTFLFFEDLVDLIRRQYDIDITVDPILENHATADQKERCIDILEFLIEN